MRDPTLTERCRQSSWQMNDTLDAIERRMIQTALAEAKGNVAEAARSLKTDRANLYRRMKRLEME